MVQVYSQNGWPAFHTPDDGKFVRFTAGGRGWWAANSDAATVAAEYIDRFNTEVETVVYPDETYDDWSFADRLVRGSTATVSNHGSATAWDVNATRHLLGVDNTFSDADEARLLDIQRSITDDAGRPVLRWGGSYSGRKDEMHIEINATKEQVRQAAAKIRAHKEDNVWSDQHKLTETDARYYGDKPGTPRSEGAFIRYPPGVERLRQETAARDKATAKTLAGLQASLNTLSAAVQAITAGSADGVRKAFADGVANLKAELADIDVQVTLGDRTDGTGS